MPQSTLVDSLYKMVPMRPVRLDGDENDIHHVFVYTDQHGVETKIHLPGIFMEKDNLIHLHAMVNQLLMMIVAGETNQHLINRLVELDQEIHRVRRVLGNI